MKKFVFDYKDLTYKPLKQKHQFIKFLKSLTFILLVFFAASLFLSSINNSPEEESIQYYKELISKIEEVENNISYLEEKDNEIYRHILDVDKREELKSISDTTIEDLNEKINYLIIRHDEQLKSSKQLLTFAKNNVDYLNHIPTLKPVSNFDILKISSDYGYRIHPIKKKRIFHYGIDFVIERNTIIRVTADGIIEAIITSKIGYGNRIIVDHLNGYKTMYAHLNGRYDVSVGDKVKKGQIIAHSGNSGLSTGPHLHYEIEKDGKILNPRLFFVNDFIE